ncbi:MAG: regulatory iron-sulfur-containing complex subunit RicT [Chloroflexota bacterium]|nr:stage 0 sporulation protein [Chloroflexota bacterium]
MPTVTLEEGQVRIAAVRFKRVGKLAYFNAKDFELKPDTWVIADIGKGTEAGRVILPPRIIEASSLTEPLHPILRIATPEDLNRMYQLKIGNKEALLKCSERIKNYDLPMKLIDGEFNHDGSRVTFYFTSEIRVDFRQLVRDLASLFRTRIELRQIGVRDKAKIVGGVDRCGRTLCCSTWQAEFPVVTVKTAKDQDLPLNPSKLTGVCGRLLCCLSFEHPMYNEMKEHMPKVGEQVSGTHGCGKVEARNILKGTVSVSLENGAYIETNYRELTREEKDSSVLIGGYDFEGEEAFELEDERDRNFLKEN